MGSLDLHLWNIPLFRVGGAFQEPALGTLIQGWGVMDPSEANTRDSHAGLGGGESFGTHILGWEGVNPLGASSWVLRSELR